MAASLATSWHSSRWQTASKPHPCRPGPVRSAGLLHEFGHRNRNPPLTFPRTGRKVPVYREKKTRTASGIWPRRRVSRLRATPAIAASGYGSDRPPPRYGRLTLPAGNCRGGAAPCSGITGARRLITLWCRGRGGCGLQPGQHPPRGLPPYSDRIGTRRARRKVPAKPLPAPLDRIQLSVVGDAPGSHAETIRDTPPDAHPVDRFSYSRLSS